MRFEPTIQARLKAMEIKYFFHDPDGDPDRFGDGMYYRVPGRDGWNGPWIDAAECRAMYREDLEFFFSSLARRMGIYEVAPRPGKRRYLLRYSGMLDPHAFDVWFFLWNLGDREMVAVVDAATVPDAIVLLKTCVMVWGDVASEEVAGNIDDICSRLHLLHPLAEAEDTETAD